MTAKTFIKKVQEYYGKYPFGQIKIIERYLQNKNEKYIALLYKKLIYNFSSKWGKPPDIAIFEEYKTDILGDLASEYKALPEYIDPETKKQVGEMLRSLVKQLTSRRN